MSPISKQNNFQDHDWKKASHSILVIKLSVRQTEIALTCANVCM